MENEWDFGAGEAEYKKAIELDPNDAIARLWYAQDIAQVGGQQDEAVAIQSGHTNSDAALANATEQGFHAGGWKSALEKAVQTGLQERKTGYTSAFEIATYCAELGNNDEAVAWLDTAYRERDYQIESLKPILR